MGGDLPPRGSFATLTDADVARFRSILESTPGDVARAVLTDEKSLADANEDWTRAYRGRSRVLLLPRTTSQVAAIVRHCNDRNLAVVPQGGNTGLVGGGVPVHDEVVLGMKRMRSVVSIDPSAGVVVAEAGVVLDDLETALNREGMTVPLDLGAKGKCQIGGNVSTNAGGLRLLRHGSLHGSVLGVEVVLASGEVLNLLKTLRKDNTGYDLKQLFIGAEGTLGVVTKVALLAPRKPRRVDVTFAAAPSFSAAVETLVAAKTELSESLQAFEFLDRASLELVCALMKGARDPLPGSEAPFYVVMETSGSVERAAEERARLDRFLADAKTRGRVVDGVVGADAKHAAALWNLRERISLALKHAGAVYKYDLSLPTARMYELVEVMRERVASAAAAAAAGAAGAFDFSRVSVLGYGHLGDGNLHLNISSPDGYDARLERIIEPHVYEWTASVDGSVSAEHGVGAMKPNEVSRSKPAAAIELMRAIKDVFDPKGILNPYKVLPPRARL